MRGRLFAAAAALALVGSVAAHAAGKADAEPLFESDIIGASPGAVAGVSAGGVAWVVRGGEASLGANGVLHLEVLGLLIAANPGLPPGLAGTTGPVTAVAASLVCGGTGGTVAATTGGVPLSPAGDAEIKQAIALPASCLAPAVLVRVFTPANPAGSQLGPYIAATGFLH